MPTQAQRGGRYVSKPFASSTLQGVGGEHHAPATLPQKKPGTLCTGFEIMTDTFNMTYKSHKEFFREMK